VTSDTRPGPTARSNADLKSFTGIMELMVLPLGFDIRSAETDAKRMSKSDPLREVPTGPAET